MLILKQIIGGICAVIFTVAGAGAIKKAFNRNTDDYYD